MTPTDHTEAINAANQPLTKQQQFSQGLRELAAFYDLHPEVKVPTFGVEITIYPQTKEDLAKLAHAFGSAEKVFDDKTFRLVKKFSGNVKLETYSQREKVCEMVKVGEKTVDVFEWRCGSILAGEVSNGNQ